MTTGLMKALLIACGTLCVVLGVIGIFLPLMPTTVFLLLAARVFANGTTEPKQMEPEKHLFGYSVFYLFALFAALVADRWIAW